tara:strand:+ start:247 stop:426 length:180 start_codon:yes stop_codon:yes gene_type:complete
MEHRNKKIKSFELFKEIDDFFRGTLNDTKENNPLINNSISHKFINNKIKRKKNGKSNWN